MGTIKKKRKRRKIKKIIIKPSSIPNIKSVSDQTMNGLDNANYNQLSGLYDLRATLISTDDISYEEIYTFNSIYTTQAIQLQINFIQNVN